MPTGHDRVSDAGDHRADVRHGDRSPAPNVRSSHLGPRLSTTVLSALLLTFSMTALAACGPNPSADTASPSPSSSSPPSSPVEKQAGVASNDIWLTISNETSMPLQVTTTGDGVDDAKLVEPNKPYFRDGSTSYTIKVADAYIRAENPDLSYPFWSVFQPDGSYEKMLMGEGEVQPRPTVALNGYPRVFSFERAGDTDSRKLMILRIKQSNDPIQ